MQPGFLCRFAESTLDPGLPTPLCASVKSSPFQPAARQFKDIFAFILDMFTRLYCSVEPLNFLFHHRGVTISLQGAKDFKESPQRLKRTQHVTDNWEDPQISIITLTLGSASLARPPEQEVRGAQPHGISRACAMAQARAIHESE